MPVVSAENKVIAFVSNSAWSVYNFRMDVIMHLMNRGFKILVIAPDDSYSSYIKDAGCEFIHINFNNKTENPLADFFLYRELKRLYQAKHPDFIFHFIGKIKGIIHVAQITIIIVHDDLLASPIYRCNHRNFHA